MKELKPSAKKLSHASKINQRHNEKEIEIPKRIKVNKTPLLSSIVPAYVWRQAAFKYAPEPFGLESEKFKDKIIEESVQTDSLERWLEDAYDPIIYSVSGVPDDSQALYFAAYLIEQHLAQSTGHANVIWETVYGGFSNELLRKDISILRPSLLILSNLTTNSSNLTLEKTRDLLIKYGTIPRIVISSGEDPLSFVSMRLHCPVNSIAYFQSSSFRQKVTVL